MLDITGSIKWFDARKGYGFVAADDGQGDVFLHRHDIVGEYLASVEPGQRVWFEVGETPYGRRALRAHFNPCPVEEN